MIALTLGNLLVFPAGGKVDPRIKREETLRRVRFAAYAAGCTRQQVAMVEAHAEGLLNSAKTLRRDQVVQAARSFAVHLLEKTPA